MSKNPPGYCLEITGSFCGFRESEESLEWRCGWHFKVLELGEDAFLAYAIGKNWINVRAAF